MIHRLEARALGLILALAAFFASSPPAFAQLCMTSGEMKRWHKVVLDCQGPQSSEGGTPNPFLNYRMDVYFEIDGQEIRVPGFFAADGNSAESGATSGSVWRAILSPHKEGQWKYRVSFREGANISISLNEGEGNPAGPNGEIGSFQIQPSDKSGKDFRGSGRVAYVGEHYPRHLGSGKYFLKSGVDSPENLMAYADFDQTTKSKTYSSHVKDWKAGDPTWKGGKGKGLVGALNYLSSRDVNSVYFLTYNVDGGDAKDVWMWTSSSEKQRFDISKLAQWDIVFDHMDKVGISMHVVTQEQENDNKLSNGELGTHRKLYYRELVARFSHHLAVVWNLGEEFSLAAARAGEFGAYIKAQDPYPNPVVVHTFPGSGHKNDVYRPLLGNASIDGASLQVDINQENNNGVVAEWINKAAQAGRKWLVQHDETGPVRKYNFPDSQNSEKYAERNRVVWGTFLGGGAGVEWIFFTPETADLKIEEFRSREKLYTYTRHAVNFLNAYLPYWEMKANNSITSAAGDYTFSKGGDLHAIYLPRDTRTDIELASGTYSVDWYNPKTGGALQKGSVAQVGGGGKKALGNPPSAPSEDWVVLVRKTGAGQPVPDPMPTPTPTSNPEQYRITRFALYDNALDQVIAGYENVQDGATIDFNRIDSTQVNIIAETSPPTVGSVRFRYNSEANRNENQGPYTVFNEDTGNSYGKLNLNAQHTITAQAFSEAGATGQAGALRTFRFNTIERGNATPAPTPIPTPTPTVAPTPAPTPTSAPAGGFEFRIYDESTKAPVPGLPSLRNGIQVDFVGLEGKALNFSVSTTLSGVRSMSMSHNGGAARNENEAPYTIFKETGAGAPQVAPGDHAVLVRAFSEPSSKGTVLGEMEIRFSLLEGPDRRAPVLGGVSIVGQFRIGASFNEEAKAFFHYKKKGDATFKMLASSEFKTSHSFDITDADATGWVYKVSGEDRAGNKMESGEQDLVVPKTVFPGAEWSRTTPEAQGVSSSAVSSALNYMKKEIGGDVNNTFIVRNGHAIHVGSGSNTKVWAASATKSFTSTVLGILIDQGKLKLNDKAATYVPELKGRYPNLELRHFATMTSGYDAEGGSYGYGGGDGSKTPFNVASPSFSPGSHFAYWDDAMNQFGHTMSQAIKENFSAVFRRHIANKIGLKSYSWTNGWTSKGLSISSGAGSGSGGPIHIGAQEMARFCHLILNKGRWNGEQLVSEAWVNEATRVQVPASMPVHQKTQGWIGVGSYGYNWWVNGVVPSGKKLWPDLPSGAFAARGTRGNMCVVVPEWNLVFVRMGTGGSNNQSVINGTLKILGQGLK